MVFALFYMGGVGGASFNNFLYDMQYAKIVSLYEPFVIRTLLHAMVENNVPIEEGSLLSSWLSNVKGSIIDHVFNVWPYREMSLPNSSTDAWPPYQAQSLPNSSLRELYNILQEMKRGNNQPRRTFLKKIYP